jgi:lipopolysaccharide biosynthesis regulator YciM
MSSAHLFYIPILIAVGFFAGFFAGRRVAEQDIDAAHKRLQRRERLKNASKNSDAPPPAD